MRFRTLVAPVAALLVLGGCDGLADLNVDNLNEPDAQRVLATPGDVLGLVGSSYLSFWQATHMWGPGPALSTAADAHSSSWGNFAMKDISSEPRAAISNNPSYGYSYVIEEPWSFTYAALKAVNDGLRAIEGAGGGDPVGLGNDEAMAKAFAKFVQGLSHGYLAMIYDQAFIVDETVGTEEIEAGLELKPYGDVMAAAVAQLEEAITIAEGADFTTPNGWVNGTPVTDEMLVRIAHSYIARYMAGVARSPAEAQAVNWQKVIDHANQGITEDFGPEGIPPQWDYNWSDILKSYGGVFSGWARLDLRFLGMGDSSGKYQSWLATAPADRTAFLITTKDERVTGEDPKADGAYVQFFSSIPFRPERGTYHFSNYGDMRWMPDVECDEDDPDFYDQTCDNAAFIPYVPTYDTKMVDFKPEELTMLKAEANMMLGNNEAAAALINETRADWLPPVTASGVPDAADCVPMEPSTTQACGDLLTALHWEKWLETWHTGSAVEFADARRWGFLASGTLLHLPVPGSELQVLQLPIYTFGGGGDGSAP